MATIARILEWASDQLYLAALRAAQEARAIRERRR